MFKYGIEILANFLNFIYIVKIWISYAAKIVTFIRSYQTYISKKVCN